MKRRDVLGALASAAVARAVLAANDPVRRIGYLGAGAPPGELAKRLAQLGWVEGRNLRFEIRHAPPGSGSESMKVAAQELVSLSPDVLVSYLDRTEALVAATKTIPIVAGFHADPVGMGLAKSLRSPGGNVTGLSLGVRETTGARIGILRTMRPRLSRIAVMHGVQGGERMRRVAKSWEEDARPLGITFDYVPCATLADAARGFDALGDPSTGAAFLILGGMTTMTLPAAIAKDIYPLAVKRRVATHGDVSAGALLFYGLTFSDDNGRMAAIIDKILRGAKPGDIPFELPDRPEFGLNRATAKAIGVDLAPEILLRVTEMID
jgi:putative ABC transport system substrate-binding protein